MLSNRISYGSNMLCFKFKNIYLNNTQINTGYKYYSLNIFQNNIKNRQKSLPKTVKDIQNISRTCFVTIVKKKRVKTSF